MRDYDVRGVDMPFSMRKKERMGRKTESGSKNGIVEVNHGCGKSQNSFKRTDLNEA